MHISNILHKILRSHHGISSQSIWSTGNYKVWMQLPKSSYNYGQLFPDISLKKQLLFIYGPVQDSLKQFLSFVLFSLETICLEISTLLAAGIIGNPASKRSISDLTDTMKLYFGVVTNRFDSLHSKIKLCISEIPLIYFAEIT